MPADRKAFHGNVVKALKPNGVLILQGFNKNQLGKTSGGPPSLDMLFNKDELAIDFQDLEIDLLQELDMELDEGPLHQGTASIIQLVGRKHT